MYETVLGILFALLLLGIYIFIRRRESDGRRSTDTVDRDTRVEEGLAEASGTAESIGAGLAEASGTVESCQGHLDTAESILQGAIKRSRKEDEETGNKGDSD